MFDDQDYAELHELYVEGARKRNWETLLELHEQLTGGQKSHPNAIMHHKLSDLGPDCPACGKPLRTPRASFCAACGN
jgi:hypothetical protein